MNNPYLRTVDWTAMSTAAGLVTGLVVTALATGLLYKAVPGFRRPQVFFWVMLGLLLVTSIGSMLVLTPLQAHNGKGGGKQAAHGPQLMSSGTSRTSD